MHIFSGFIFAVFLSLAACDDFDCFIESSKKCEIENFKYDKDLTSTCKLMYMNFYCQVIAARECKLDFVRAAEDAFSWQLYLCSDGTDLNKALTNDENCNMDSLIKDYHTCTTNVIDTNESKTEKTVAEEYRIVCRNLDNLRDCHKEVFGKCSDEAESALNKFDEKIYNLFKQVCKIVPPS